MLITAENVYYVMSMIVFFVIAIFWLARLEFGYQTMRELFKEKVASDSAKEMILWSEIKSIHASQTEILQSLARLEATLGIKK